MTEPEAGRDLDALIAEKVMGLQVVAHDWPCGRDPECGGYEANTHNETDDDWYNERGPVYAPVEHGWPPHMVGGEGNVLNKMYPGRLYAFVRPVPFYSTDANTTWAVVEQIVASGTRDIDVRYTWAGPEAHWWLCQIGPRVAATGATPMEAICRAALRWRESN